jgi:serine/threonine-protein kinase
MPGYRLSEKLGVGGFGEVWAATAPDGKSVALKFIDCQGKPGSAIAHEIRMMRCLKDLRHPYFIRLHGVCASSPHIVIIMERADGSLKDLLNVYLQETGQHIPTDHLLELLEQAAVALDSLAELKLPGFTWLDGCVQHCDVKPTNLLVMGDTLKVADFGLCSSAKQDSGGQGFRGTPPYAAPELYEGRTTSRTDQYGLAVSFCELCRGPRAFLPRADDNLATYPGPPIDLTKIRDNEYPVLARALSERWTDRYPNCRAFVAALKAASRPSHRVNRIPAEAVPQ